MSNLSIEQTRALASALVRNVDQQKQVIKTRSSRAPTLEAPSTPVWWGGDPEFAGLVPRPEQEQPMALKIPLWPERAKPGETDWLQLQWKASTSGSWLDAGPAIPFVGPLEPADFPTEVVFDKSNFADEGTYDLQYIVVNDSGNPGTSFTTQFRIDKTPPNGGQAPMAVEFFDADIIGDGITQDYLNTNGGVDLVIPHYLDEQKGDELQIFVFRDGTSPTGSVHTGVLDGNRRIKVPAAAFAGIEDGTIFVSYKLADKVGNVGDFALNQRTGLFLKPLPIAPLAAPRVPKAAGDNTLQLVDIDSNGTNLVEIDPFLNALENDNLVLTWGNAPTTSSHKITDPNALILINVPYKTMLGPAYGSATGVVPTTVSYYVARGTKTFDSAPATINVDFFVPGPVNPDRPNPVNTKLPQVTVKGAVSTVDNVLTKADVGEDVTVALELYDPISPNEEMVLYWGDLTKEVARLSPVVGTAGDAYEFVLGWDKIKDLPSSTAVPVFYTVGRIRGAGDPAPPLPNVESCVPTLVDVSDALPIKLANPEFPLAYILPGDIPILNCSTHVGPEQLVRVRIPANPNLKGGETLDFTWQCYVDKEGTQTAGAPSTFSKTITAEQVADGFTFDQGPFTEYVLPTGASGSIRVTYRSVTTPPMQGETLIRATGLGPGGTCEPNTLRALGGRGCCC